MTTPALQRLREKLPNAHITMLTHEKLADLWQGQPFIDDVIAFTSKESVFQVGRRLRWGNFDAGLTFPNSPRSGIELWHGRIPRRIGYSRAWRNLFLTETIRPRPEEIRMRKRSVAEVRDLIEHNPPPEKFPNTAHHVHQYLHLMAAAFGTNPEFLPPKIVIGTEEAQAVAAKFSISNGLICGLNPGAEYGPAKRWLKERFVDVAIKLHRETGCRWVVFGGKGDFQLSEEISVAINHAAQGEAPAVNVAGKTSLRELCALMKICRVVLTNDTGPMHVAVAVGTRVVVPFGSTSPELTAPGVLEDTEHLILRADVPCSPCFLRECPIDFRCMNGISTEQVASALRKIIGQSR
jgi:heptosyltransferase-2